MSRDIQTKILLSLPNTGEILNYCTVNKQAKEICSEAYFWKLLFDEHDLPFPTMRYNDPYAWVLAFKKEKVIKDNIQHFMSHIEHKNLMQDAYINYLTLDAYTNYAFFDILNVDGVDLKDLSTIENSFVLGKLTDSYHPSDCKATLSYDGKYYVVEIDYRPHHDMEYLYFISQESMEQILYNDLSRGAELLSSSGFKMRFKK